MRAIATFLAMVVLMMTPAFHAGAESQVTLTIRLYNTAGIANPELLAARRAAESILRDTGLNVVFRECAHPVAPRTPDRCDDSLKRSEVVVRIIDAPAFNVTLHPDAFGVAYVVKETDRGWLATVFPDRIDQAAARVGVEPGTLLGRVVAHEVGHLLLGVNYHGETGLMRADWPDALLTHKDIWRFSMREATRMHRALLDSAAL